jgi:hypothetical protein
MNRNRFILSIAKGSAIKRFHNLISIDFQVNFSPISVSFVIFGNEAYNFTHWLYTFQSHY